MRCSLVVNSSDCNGSAWVQAQHNLDLESEGAADEAVVS
jgi:hypothetical protein